MIIVSRIINFAEGMGTLRKMNDRLHIVSLIEDLYCNSMRQMKKCLFIIIIILVTNSCDSYNPQTGYFKLDISSESVIAGTKGTHTIDDFIDKEGFWVDNYNVPFIRAVNISILNEIQLYFKDGTISNNYKISSCKIRRNNVQIQFFREDDTEVKYGLQFFGSDSLKFGIMENKKKLNGFIYTIVTKSERPSTMKYDDIVSYLQNEEIIGKCKSIRDTLFLAKKEFGDIAFYPSSYGISNFNEYGSLINKRIIDSSGKVIFDKKNTFVNNQKEKSEIYSEGLYSTPEKSLFRFDSLENVTYYENNQYVKIVREYKYKEVIEDNKKVLDIIDSKTNSLIEKVITESDGQTSLKEAHYRSDGKLYYTNYFRRNGIDDVDYSFWCGYPNGYYITFLGDLDYSTVPLSSEVPYTSVNDYSYGYTEIELKLEDGKTNNWDKLCFDSYGNIQSSIYICEGKHNNKSFDENSLYTYKYVFDGNENWIKRKKYKDGELYSLETRIIEY